MTFWDVAAGILIAAFLIASVMYGWGKSGDTKVGTAAIVFAALIVIWRANCWYGTIKCEAHPYIEMTSHQ